jgi:hypothetical protein
VPHPDAGEVFELHRRHAGLMHLDIKRPGLDAAIADLLTRMDLWDHVAYCSTDTAGAIVRDPRYVPRRYKGGLYLDRGEVFPDAIAAVLKRPGDGVIVDDPRGVALALGRTLGKLPAEPVSPRPVGHRVDVLLTSEEELVATLRDAPDWDWVPATALERAASAVRIRARARAAERLLMVGAKSPEALAALTERVTHRSLHPDWIEHGLDGAMALRTLLLLRAPGAVETARAALWRDDPALDRVADPRWKNPRPWTDFRVTGCRRSAGGRSSTAWRTPGRRGRGRRWRRPRRTPSRTASASDLPTTRNKLVRSGRGLRMVGESRRPARGDPP